MKRLTLITFMVLAASYLFAQPGWYVVPNAPITQRFEDVSLIGNTAWIADNDNFSGTVIFKSLDKGDSWFATDTIFPIGGTGFYVRSVEFMNDSIGLIGILSQGSGLPVLFRTTDGGNTFNPVASPAFSNADGICGMAHFGNTFIGVGIYSGQANFFKSTDAGATWNVTNLGAFADGLVDCYMFNDTTYLVSGHGLAAQQNAGVILRTTDGGVNWQQVALDSDPFGYCWKMNFTPNGKGVGSIQDSEHIFITSDFGATWSIDTVGNCSYDFGGTAFLNDTMGWVGDQYWASCFYATVDGGTTWIPYTFGTAIDRMVVLDSTHVMAVGETVYKFSFDSMFTNTVTHIPVSKSLHSVDVYPTPAKKTVNIRVSIDEATLCSIYLLDAKQHFIRQVERKQRSKGDFVLTEDISVLPAGNYILYVTTFQRHMSKKFVVVK